MPSDITLAVGDGARRMTYAELAAVRGTSQPSAERLVRRRGWPRQVGNDGLVRVLVPLTEARNVSNSADGTLAPATPEMAPDTSEVAPTPVKVFPRQMAPDDRGHVRGLENAVEALQEQLEFANKSLIDERKRVDELLHQLADASEKGPETNPLPAIAIQTLSQAVEMLREDVGHERDRADQAEQKIDELTEDRRRDAEERRQLLTDLADARTAAMITGCEAAALRSRIEILTDRRPWWRRWFR